MKCLFPGKRSTWELLGIGLLSVALFSGCGGPYTGTVSGKVIYKGQPLQGGIVTFIHPADGRIGYGQIQEDGSYTVLNAPGGDHIKCKVETVQPIPGVRGYSETVYPAGKYVPIPKKYANPDTSGFSLSVGRGSQTFDIELKD